MKHIRQFTKILILPLMMVGFFGSSTYAQWAGGAADCFLQGYFTEVGISRCGTFGSAAAPPAGYHRNATLPGIGFTSDAGRNGWTTAGPGTIPNYCGDYFLPGSPVEGFGVQVGASVYINTNSAGVCDRFDITGSITSYAVLPGRKVGTWNGNITTGAGAGMTVSNVTSVYDSGNYHVTQVQLCNPTATAKTDVYYLRHVDPDNDQPWAGGSFTTTNTVVSQGTGASGDALVSAVGRTGCYLGLGARNPMARVSRGGFFTPNPADVWNGIAPYVQTVGVASTADEAVSLSIRFPTIAPGTCECFGYAYVLRAADLSRALAATTPTAWYSGSTDISDSLRTNLCDSNSVTLRVIGPSTYTWTWSPPIYLSRTTGDTVICTPRSSTNYTVIGVGPCGRDTFNVFVNVDTSLRSARIARYDTTICRGASTGLVASGAASYTWTPASWLTSTTSPTPVATPPATTTYSCTFRSISGCTLVRNTRVGVDTLKVSAGRDTSLCPGRSANILGSYTSPYAGMPYSWTTSPAVDSTFLSSTSASSPLFTIPGSVLGPDTVNLFLTVSQYGCVARDTMTVSVLARPAVDILNLDSIHCVSDPSYALISAPSGGVWSGPGMIDSTFRPGVAGPGGPYRIIYNYTTSAGCTNRDTAITYVAARPVVSFSGLAAQYCFYDSSVALTGVPAGGTFTGSGISGNRFYPINAGVGGPYSIIYTYRNPITDCINADTQRVTVNGRPAIDFSGLDTQYCLYASSAILVPVPTGGTFSGPGISGSTFTPSSAGIGGPYSIIYNYTSPASGCVNADTAYTRVNGRPSIAFSGLASRYCIYDAAVTLNPVPAGGTFSGTGISGTSFSPSTAGVGGPYRIIYNYTSPLTGCTNSDTQYTTINPRPTVSFSGLDTQYCNYAASVTLTGSPAGGTFSGSGISGTTFAPSAVAVGGPYFVVYTYTNPATGCLNLDSNRTRINGRPSVSFTGLDSQYCYYASAVTLTAAPVGGTFSGPGVSGSTFTPSTAGMGGPYLIIYNYTSPSTLCANADTHRVTITDRPAVSFSGLAGHYCIYDAAITLTGSPTGGTFTGTGITGTSFNPATAGIGGPYRIIYSYVNPTTGCSNADTQYVTVYGRPVVDFTGLDTQYCVYASAAALNGIPAGGSFSGPGISGSIFTPSSAGVGGAYSIIYTYTDAATGCINRDTSLTRVNGRPAISFTGLATQYCLYNPIAVLNPSPVGGTFSGTGVTGSSFNPSAAGIGGPYSVIYTYTNPVTGCMNIDSQRTTVNGRPAVSYSGLSAAYCINAPAVTLSGSPAGGTFSGAGMSGSTFTPSSAGVGGPYSIIYDYTSPTTGCNNKDTQYVRVNPLPTPTFTGLASSYCSYASPVTLTGVPAGGTFSGPGMSGATFTPSSAGVGGPYRIIYFYTDPVTGCSNRDTQLVTVNGRPIITITGLAANYCINASAATITGSPAGGTFSGTGMSGSTFTPSTAGIGGPYQIVYEFTNPVTGCYNKDSAATRVVPLPTPSFTGLASAYCVNATAAVLTGSPVGGSFSGPGIAGSSFNPAAAGAGGPYRIQYFYTDGFGCSNIDTQFTRVNPLPIANAGPDDTICLGSTGGLTASGGINYLWSPGGFVTSSIIVGPSRTTVYTVTVTDGNGCSASDNATVFVKIITMNFNSTNVSCYGLADGTAEAVPLTGKPPYTYEWSDSRHQTTNPATGLAAGVYFVTVTDADLCAGIDSVRITEPAIFRVFFTKENARCYGDSNGVVNCRGTGGTLPYTFTVTRDSITYYTGANITTLPAGFYTGVGRDRNGCEDYFSFTITQPTPIVVNYTYSQPRCYGYSDGSFFVYAMGGSPTYIYKLNGETSTSGWFSNLRAGTYTLEVTDMNNCTVTTVLPLNQPDPIIVNLNPDTIQLELGQSGQFFTTFTGANADSVIFVWNTTEGMNCTDCPNPIVNPYNDMMYEVKVISTADVSNPRPCTGTAIGYVFVRDGDPIYIPNAFTPNGDGSNDEFLIYGKAIKSVYMQIYDRWGEKMFESYNQREGWDGRYKGKEMNPGVYVYYVSVEYLNGKKMEQTGSVTLLR